MLDATTLNQLTGLLERLQGDIELVVATDDSPASRDLSALVAQIVGASPRVRLRELGPEADVRRPSFGVARAGQEPRVRFAGLPMGHEFTSLVLALLQVSGYPPKIDDATRAAVEALPGGLHFETFVSLSCHNCPEVVQALNILAALNPGVTAEMIDGGLFPAEIEARKIMGVPAVFLNGALFSQGRATLPELLAKVDVGAADRAAAKLAEAAPYDVLVVGGGPAGAAAALYAARKGIRTAIVAERFGGQVGDTLGIENFLSVAYTEGPKLVSALESHVRSVGVEVHVGQRVTALEPAGADGLHGLRLANGALLRARAVVLAPGARWRELGVPGEAEHKTRGVAFCPHCDGPLFKGKRVAVIGGGNSGVEAAIDLAGLASSVTLLEYDTKLRADEVLQARLRSLPNVEVRVNTQTTEVLGDGQKVHALAWRDRSSGERVEADLEGVFVQIGLLPNTDWLRGTVALSPRGEIEVDARGATSVPGVYAAGDATTVPYKQIVIAMGEGAKASLSAFDHLMRAPVAA
jgi:alkyl hydroperoxide reductase subunit F